MATLTTTDNVQYYFDPGAVFAISDRDPSTGRVVTCIHGISGRAYLPIAESVQAFIARVKIAAADFASVSGPNGTVYLLRLSSVVSICPTTVGAPPGTHAVVFAGSQNFSVVETPQTAAAALKISA